MVVVLILPSELFAFKLKAQDNNASTTNFHPLASLNEGVLYKNPEVEQIAYEIWQAKQLVGKRGGQCVTFVRKFTGEGSIRGAAKNIKTTSSIPASRTIIKTAESKSNHLVYGIYYKEWERKIVLVESNYGYNERVSMRELSVDDPKIIGFIPLD